MEGGIAGPNLQRAPPTSRDKAVQTDLSGCDIDRLIALAAAHPMPHLDPPRQPPQPPHPVQQPQETAAAAARPVPRKKVREWDPATWVRFSKKFPKVYKPFTIDPRFKRYLKQQVGLKEDSAK